MTPGLIDMQVFAGEPGYEHRETLKTDAAGRADAAATFSGADDLAAMGVTSVSVALGRAVATRVR